MTEKRNEISPQKGPQTEFLSTKADIAIYGGAAGGGKSFALLLEPLRHFNNGNFSTVIFRRETPQITNPGGLWSEAIKLYLPLGMEDHTSGLHFTSYSGMRIKFSHLEMDSSVYSWQGAQIPLICYDELTHFTESQFFYMLSRNRSISDVPGYIRATTNPDSKSWVKSFIQWWIDPNTGFPIPERSGKIRWFSRQDDKIIWADSREEILKEYPESFPKSVTFIAAKLEDNQILMQKDPTYKANLLALPRVERERLLYGNWNIEQNAGQYFKREYFEVVDAAPTQGTLLRYWDRASTQPNDSNKDPDWTVGLKVLKDKNGTFWVLDMARFRQTPAKVQQAIHNLARQDGIETTVYVEQDPGQAGVADVQAYQKLLSGFVVKVNRVSQDKITRSLPASAQAEQGNIKILRGAWNQDFFTELENFPEAKHDDIVDCLSGSINMFQAANVGDFTTQMAKNGNRGTIAGSMGTLRW